MSQHVGLWDDIDGERWLDNPQLIIAGNPRRKRRSKMAKSTKRRRRGRKGTTRRRRVRRNYAASGLINSPRRRRRGRRASPRRRRRAYSLNPRRRVRRGYRRSPRRRRYSRNPSMSLMGFRLPAIADILSAGAGLVVPPVMAGYLMGYVPATWKTSKLTYYGVKVASVVLPSMIVRRFVSRRAGNIMLLAGAATFAVDLVREFAPSLLPTAGVAGQPFLGFYESMPRRGAGMGRYASIPVRSQPVQRTPLLSLTPERLSPGARF